MRLTTVFFCLLLCDVAHSKDAATKPSTAPATKEWFDSQRVVFAVDGGGGMAMNFDDARKEVLKRVKELSSPQSFNIISGSEHGMKGFREGVVPAVEAQFSRAALFLDGCSPRGHLIIGDLLKATIKQRPNEVVLFCYADREPEGMEGVKFPDGVRVTVIIYGGSHPPLFLAQLAKTSGGKCLDAIGKEIGPRVPLPPPPTPTPQPKPKPADEEKGVILQP